MLVDTLQILWSQIDLLITILNDLDLLEKGHFQLPQLRIQNEDTKLETCKSVFENIASLSSDLCKVINEVNKEEKEDVTPEVKIKKQIHNCKICRKQFSSDSSLQYHIKNLHQNEEQSEILQHLPIFVCQICYQAYKTINDFENHKCKSCANETNTSANLHQNTPKLFTNIQILQTHNRFTCGYCLEEFRLFSRTECHLTKCRGGPFPCQLCHDVFQIKKDLILHKTKQHAESKPFACDECPKKFKLNTSLQKHLANRHESKNKGFKCDKCNKSFVKRVYLTNHQSRFHHLFKPFLCQICGKRFLHENSLKSHGQIHVEEAKFKCQFCEKSFNRKDKLTFHEAVHLGHRPFKCSLCNKAFIRKSKLQEHLRRHRGDKRWECLECHKGFSSSYEIKQHLIRHHPEVKIKPGLVMTMPQVNLQDDFQIL